jgi:hypothetical protein
MSEKEAGPRGKKKGSKVSPVSLLLSSREGDDVEARKKPFVRFDLPVSIQVPPSRTTHRSPSTSSDGAGAPPAPEGGHGVVLSAVANTPFWRAYVSRTTGRKSEAETIAKTWNESSSALVGKPRTLRPSSWRSTDLSCDAVGAKSL